MHQWNTTEIETLSELYPNLSYSVEEIAERLNRTPASIRSTAVQLDITRGVKRWKTEYDDFLKENYKKLGITQCAKVLGYSERHILRRAKELGLAKKIDFWTDEETVKLKELCNAHFTRREIAKRLNKTVSQVCNKMERMGLSNCWWSEDEIKFLKTNYNSKNAKEIAKQLNRTKAMIYRKASELGITLKDNSGRNHYAFREDKRDYPPEWTRALRKKIKERDNYKCKLCGKSRKETILQVHHIDYNKGNSDESNLITLCIACHAKTNVNRDYWQSALSKLLEKSSENHIGSEIKEK